MAFLLIQKLLALNVRSPDKPVIEVILLSRNSADTGLRVFNSIQHHSLPITRAAFTQGQSTSPFVKVFGAHIFLSSDPRDVRAALDAGHAAATILQSSLGGGVGDQLRIAFDGDAVIFSDESERIFKTQGLEAFRDNDRDLARVPFEGGPFKPLLAAIQQIQQQASAPPRW